MGADAGLLGDVGKCAIAVVEKELARQLLVELRMAVLRLSVEFAVRFLAAVQDK